MTVHDMLQQVSLFSSGTYQREGDVSSLTIPLPGGRRQTMFGKLAVLRGETVGVLYTNVGTLTKNVDLMRLLELNASLRYSRVAITDGDRIVLVAFFDIDATSIRQCTPMLQELGAVADELERVYFDHDDG